MDRHWALYLARLLGDVGYGVIGLGGCIGVYERTGSSWMTAIALLIWMAPALLHRSLKWRDYRVVGVVIMVVLGLKVFWMSGADAASMAEMLIMAALGQLMRMPTDRANAPARSFRYACAGILAPALVAMVSAYGSREGMLLTAVVMLLASVAADALIDREKSRMEPEKAPALAALPADVRIVDDAVTLVLAMCCGGLVTPMLLSCASVNVLCSAIGCFAAGVLVGSLGDPTREFFGSERRSLRICGVAVFVLVMLYGMARAGWQWNLLALLGGWLIRTMDRDLREIHPGAADALSGRHLIVSLIGLAAGLLAGEGFDWIIARSVSISRICARLTGQGEGKGYAMVMVCAGFLGGLWLYHTLKMKSEE